MGKIYYLMGKSASGKDHIYEHLIQETALDLKPFVLYTTRPIRSGEQDGREYFFVDEKRLSELRGAGKIIEERMYSTVQGPWYYFTADDGQIDLVKHDYLGIGDTGIVSEIKGIFRGAGDGSAVCRGGRWAAAFAGTGTGKKTDRAEIRGDVPEIPGGL